MNQSKKKEWEDASVSKMDLQALETSQLVELALAKKRKRDFADAELDAVNAQLQIRAALYQEEKHIKFTEFQGQGSGFASVTMAASLEVVNFPKLLEFFGSWWEEAVKIKPQETKYVFDNNFKKAVLALILGDYEPDMSLDTLLENTGWCNESHQKTALIKKLKGDYKKDKKTICDMLSLSSEEDMDVELYMIYQIKNWELIKSYFDTSKLEEAKEVLSRYMTASEIVKIGLKEV